MKTTRQKLCLSTFVGRDLRGRFFFLLLAFLFSFFLLDPQHLISPNLAWLLAGVSVTGGVDTDPNISENNF